MKLTDLSKEISYALRHAPQEYELELDEDGFVPIDQLLHALNEGGNYDRAVTKDDLEEIIRTSEKKRHEIVGDDGKVNISKVIEAKMNDKKAATK